MMAHMPRVYDLTPLIDAALPVWPGDSPVRREVLMDMKRGDSITLSTFHGTVHLGAHADAPSHYGTSAPSIETRSLDFYLGLCQLMRLSVPRRGLVRPSDLARPVEAERVLLATGSFSHSTQFNQDFAALDPTLIDALHDQGVRLIGVDAL